MTTNCAQFIADSFAIRTAAHTAHLLTRSYAHHVALDEFYNDMLDKVDEYAEVAMGLDPDLKHIPNSKPPVFNTPVQLLQDYLQTINDHMGEYDEDDEAEYAALANILAELQALTARALYKIQRLA